MAAEQSKDIDVLSKTEWDAIVIGAGPAGSLAALQIARSFERVLLIEKAHFPRYKVCGCCLNFASTDALREAGLDIDTIGGVSLESIDLYDGGKSSSVPLEGSIAVSREYFDFWLVNSAVNEGVNFLHRHTATVTGSSEESASVRVVDEQKNEANLVTKLVIVADGLSGHSLDLLPEFKVSVLEGSRFGAGCILPSAAGVCEPGRIYMCCDDKAYVGMVALENGSLDIAAAFDRNYSRKNEGPAEAARKIILNAGFSLPPGYSQATWTGTNMLTRRRNAIAGTRIFVIGDACGYAEPFTGEGIAWALWSANAVSRLALEAVKQWRPGLISEWNLAYSKLFDHRLLRSRVIAGSLRNTIVRRAAVAFISGFPALARPFIHQLSGRSMRKDYIEQIAHAG